jgi:hypothetical protein
MHFSAANFGLVASHLVGSWPSYPGERPWSEDSPFADLAQDGRYRARNLLLERDEKPDREKHRDGR